MKVHTSSEVRTLNLKGKLGTSYTRFINASLPTEGVKVSIASIAWGKRIGIRLKFWHYGARRIEMIYLGESIWESVRYMWYPIEDIWLGCGGGLWLYGDMSAIVPYLHGTLPTLASAPTPLIASLTDRLPTVSVRVRAAHELGVRTWNQQEILAVSQNPITNPSPNSNPNSDTSRTFA